MQMLKFSRAVNSKTLKNFEDNIIRQKGVDFCIKYLEKNAYSPTIVTCAFDWMDTPEGAYYWRDVERAWLKYLNTQEKLEETNKSIERSNNFIKTIQKSLQNLERDKESQTKEASEALRNLMEF